MSYRVSIFNASYLRQEINRGGGRNAIPFECCICRLTILPKDTCQVFVMSLFRTSV